MGTQRDYENLLPALVEASWDAIVSVDGQQRICTWNIIAAHGGEITFDTEIGQGTTFRVALPRPGRNTRAS